MTEKKENETKTDVKPRAAAVAKKGTSNWDLMRLAEEQDCEAFEARDFEELPMSKKSKYKEFYDDVKQPSDYVTEDW